MKYTLTDAKMELRFLKDCFADEIAASYSDWQDAYLERMQSATGKIRGVYSQCLDVIKEKYEEFKLNDAEESLACLETCPLDEIARNYRTWKDSYVCEIHDAPTPEIRRTYQACLDLLEEKNAEAYER